MAGKCDTMCPSNSIPVLFTTVYEPAKGLNLTSRTFIPEVLEVAWVGKLFVFVRIVIPDVLVNPRLENDVPNTRVLRQTGLWWH